MIKRLFLSVFGREACNFCLETRGVRDYHVTQHSAFPEDDPESGNPEPLRFKLCQEIRLCDVCYHRSFDRRLYDVLPL